MIEQGLRERLATYEGLASLVGNRVYAVLLPQDPVLPAIVYFRVSGVHEDDFSGTSGVTSPRFQVSIYANSYAETIAIAKQVRLCLHGFAGNLPDEDQTYVQGIFLNNDIDAYEEMVGMFRKDMDFTIWHNEEYNIYGPSEGGFNAPTDWNLIDNKPTFAPVALTGKYADLTDAPALAPVALSGSYADLVDTPTEVSSDWNSLTNKPTFATVALTGSWNDLINKPTMSLDWASITGKPTFATIATTGSWADLRELPVMTGTGALVLSQSPTITGTLTAGTLSLSADASWTDPRTATNVSNFSTPALYLKSSYWDGTLNGGLGDARTAGWKMYASYANGSKPASTFNIEALSLPAWQNFIQYNYCKVISSDTGGNRGGFQVNQGSGWAAIGFAQYVGTQSQFYITGNDSTGAGGKVLQIATQNTGANNNDWDIQISTPAARGKNITLYSEHQYFKSGNAGASYPQLADFSHAGLLMQMKTTNTSPNAADVPLTVKGAVSQTGDLQQWQDSNGTTLSKVNKNGTFITNGPAFDPTTNFWLFDDCMSAANFGAGNIAGTGYVLGNGAGQAGWTAASDHPGQTYISTTTTANQGSYMVYGGWGFPWPGDSSRSFITEMCFLLSSVTSMLFRWGHTTASGANPVTNGTWLEYDSAVSPHFYLRGRNTPNVDVDTGVTAAAATWYKVKVQGDGTNVSYYINGTLVGSVTQSSYMQGGGSGRLSWQVLTYDTTAKVVAVDYISHWKPVTR